MEEQLPERQYDLKTFKRWRNIQMAALLPLILTGVFLLYFKEPSVLGIVSFFLILIVGVLLPQLRADLILSHIVLRKELRAKITEARRKDGQGSRLLGSPTAR